MCLWNGMNISFIWYKHVITTTVVILVQICSRQNWVLRETFCVLYLVGFSFYCNYCLLLFLLLLFLLCCICIVVGRCRSMLSAISEYHKTQECCQIQMHMIYISKTVKNPCITQISSVTSLRRQNGLLTCEYSGSYRCQVPEGCHCRSSHDFLVCAASPCIQCPRFHKFSCSFPRFTAFV